MREADGVARAADERAGRPRLMGCGLLSRRRRRCPEPGSHLTWRWWATASCPARAAASPASRSTPSGGQPSSGRGRPRTSASPCSTAAPSAGGSSAAGWRAYRGCGVAFVGIDVWDQEADARAFLRQYGVTYANGPDPSGQIQIDDGVTGLPETYYAERDGTLRRHWIGPITDEELRGTLGELLS